MATAQGFDRWQPVLVAALTAAGLVTLESVSPSSMRHQLLFVPLAAAGYLVASLFDYRRLARYAMPVYGVGILALAAVAVLGHTRLGAQRWLSVGGVPLEPSELDKLVMVVLLAALLSRPGPKTLRRLLEVSILSAIPIGLVLLQPDLGTAIVFAVLYAGMLFVAQIPWRQLALLALAFLGSLPLVPHMLHGYQRQRLAIFLDPSKDPLGAGYNLLQARIAVGSGGWLGHSWASGSAAHLGYLPASTTDFVFAVFADQFGLIGCLVLLIVYGLLLWRLARAILVAPDTFGRLLCAGTAVMLAVQVIQNVGMNVGLTPIAGIPLPFISAGGSSLVTLATALGLVQSVLRSRQPLAARVSLLATQPVGAPGGAVRLRL